MKSIERHKIKQDRFQVALRDALVAAEHNRRPITIVIGVLVAIALGVAGVSLYRSHVNGKASALLAEAMVIAEAPVVPPTPPAPPAEDGTTPPPPPEPPAGSYPTEQAKHEAALPKFLAAADAYPSTPAGVTARYHAATTLVALGRDADAEKAFAQVIQTAGDGLYARMARLGLADIQVRTGRYDEAIAAYKELQTNAGRTQLPVEAILMQLGQAYVRAGRNAEAVETFERITADFASSPYAAEAKQEIDRLKS